MAKANKVRQLKSCYKKLHIDQNPISTCSKNGKDVCKKNKHYRALETKDWKDAICSVCMESPHNAVLLLCSSYSKGCRPYMCATSYRFSNCLDQYKKAYTKPTSLQNARSSCELLDLGWLHDNEEVLQLSCPICRGQVKGWTLVEPARKDLNKRKRSCMQENCSFVGSYKQLRKHVRAEHPLSRPRDVDPALEEKWKSLERERERNDVVSAITSADPGAVVFGDFVIEGNHNPFYRSFDHVGGFLDENHFRVDPFLNSRLFSRRLGLIAETRAESSLRSLQEDVDTEIHHHTAGDDDDDADVFPASRHPRRLLFGRIGRRARNREAN